MWQMEDTEHSSEQWAISSWLLLFKWGETPLHPHKT